MIGTSASILLVLTLLIAPECFAVQNRLEYELGHGDPLSSVQANGSSDRAGSQGTVWSADILHFMGNQFYLGLGGGQFRSGDNVSQTFVPNANSTLSSTSSSILILSRQDVSVNQRFVTYLVAGIGWVKNTLTITAVPVTNWADTGTSEQRTLWDHSRDSIAFAAGAGLDWNLTSSLYAGAEVRYQNALSRNFPTTPVGQATTGQTSTSTSMNNLFYALKIGVTY